ncbi:MAG: VanZ family protein [Clostridia bacterium]|nr:VanZ family protein [Clostridia bacterium]
MTVLPSQKLTIGELFVSLAAGLMFFLLPNDAKNQFDSIIISECFVMLICSVITLVLFIIIKRFEAVGVAMLTYAVLTLVNIVFSIITGIFSNTKDYWPTVSEYNIVCMFIIWVIPFFFMTITRLLQGGQYDNNERRMGFSRFILLSMRALLILYGLVIIFMMIIPYKPRTESPREIDFMIFSRIGDCIKNIHEDGTKYILWHNFILAPLTFYLLVLIPKIKFWHLLIISGTFALTIEALQYLLNTGTACLDDIIMYIVGAIIGIMLKHLIDSVRSVLTSGKDDCMLSYSYTPIKRKTDTSAAVIIDE